jgi:hypothetical protein
MRAASRLLRRPVAMYLVLFGGPFVASACAMEEVLPAPSCVDGGTLILTAQSVPTADLVPCFEPFPNGWDVVSVEIDQDGTVVEFDSDRAGEHAAVFRYAGSCDASEAVSAPSEFDDAERYEDIERVAPSFGARRFYVFDGGCTWWEFDFDAGATAALAIELGDRLTLVSRAEINQSIRDTFIDEEV